MAFVPQRRCGSEDEGPRHHSENEGKAEEKEWITIHMPPIVAAKGVLVGTGPVLLEQEIWHVELDMGR